MAGAPSRDPVVLRRLGIIKDPGDPFLQESRAQRETSRDALELFANEGEPSARLEPRPKAIRPHAASPIDVIRRNPLIGVIAVSAVSVVLALWAINRFFPSDGSSVQTRATVPTAADTSAATSSEVAATEPTNTSQRPSAANANTLGSADGTISRSQQAVGNRREDVDAVTIGPGATASQPDSGQASAATPDAPPAVPSAAEPTATVVDDTIYSAQDRDVVPPQTSETLPGPTISSWTTRTNAMEVIVSETGTVERVRLVSPPARMPDTFVLSRAKVWKFTPAMKDGKPVRYRLLLTWEVNP